MADTGSADAYSMGVAAGSYKRGGKVKRDKKRWIQGAIRKPGAVKEAAKRHGKSVSEEARSESHSTDPKIASRGRLAMRFKGMAKHGNIRKKKSRPSGR